MSAKRGQTDYSLVVAVNKPAGMSSHDVVNRVRRIFGERRVGHMGTLDPMASGVLPVCVGPATRLDAYLVEHNKRYRMRVEFGAQTDTDDAEGRVIKTGNIPAQLYDEAFARTTVQNLVGKHRQTPPQYSAIKVNGKTAYKEARNGNALELEPREIEIFEARLLSVEAAPSPAQVSWSVELAVSKGTYIRSIARDLGESLGCPAHLSSLERVQLGMIDVHDCMTLDTLEALKEQACVDPVRLLRLRFCFADSLEDKISNGAFINPTDVQLYDPYELLREDEACACSAMILPSEYAPRANELVSVVCANKLKAIYKFDAQAMAFKPACIFSIGVRRG